MHQQDKRSLDEEIRGIVANPSLGVEKKGDLRGVFGHKFKINTTQYLLAYRLLPDGIELIMLGVHENY